MTEKQRTIPAGVQLALLVAINFVNYFDRALVPALEVEIRNHFLAGDPQALTKSGLLTSVFLISYMLAAPAFGALVAIFPRWRVIAVGVALWSLASAGSGLAFGFGFLLLMRALVGVGEAAYGPASPAMIGDLFSQKRRGSMMALFYLAMPVGSAMAYALGPWVRDRFGWEWAFFGTAIPGLILAILCLAMPESRADRQLAANRPKKTLSAAIKGYTVFFKHRSFMANCMAMTCVCFCIGALNHFFGEFLQRRGEPDSTRTTFGIVAAVAGLLATITGGLLADWLRSRVRGAHFVICGFGALLAFPMILGFLFTPFPVAWIFVFLAVFFLFLNTGPANAAIANTVSPEQRPAAFALNILLIHALGDAISPTIVGSIADRWSLDAGFIGVSIMLLAGGFIWLMNRRQLEYDTLPDDQQHSAGSPGSMA